MSNMPDEKCHKYCKYGKQCRYLEGSNGLNPDECDMYGKIEKVIMEWEPREMEDDDD